MFKKVLFAAALTLAGLFAVSGGGSVSSFAAGTQAHGGGGGAG